jgi:hypothetical protein
LLGENKESGEILEGADFDVEVFLDDYLPDDEDLDLLAEYREILQAREDFEGISGPDKKKVYDDLLHALDDYEKIIKGEEPCPIHRAADGVESIEDTRLYEQHLRELEVLNPLLGTYKDIKKGEQVFNTVVNADLPVFGPLFQREVRRQIFGDPDLLPSVDLADPKGSAGRAISATWEKGKFFVKEWVIPRPDQSYKIAKKKAEIMSDAMFGNASWSDGASAAGGFVGYGIMTVVECVPVAGKGAKLATKALEAVGDFILGFARGVEGDE